MALEKQSVTFGMGQGLSLKSGLYTTPLGKFNSLQNGIFDAVDQLNKRNGFGSLTPTIGSISYLTTFQGNLIGLGRDIQAYTKSINSFTYKGIFPQVQVSVTPLSNAVFGQTVADMSIADNGIMCEAANNTFTTPLVSQWQIIDKATGNVLSGPTQIVSSGGLQQYGPRVFTVGSQFTIVFDAQKPLDVNSFSFLEYITIPVAGPYVASPVRIVSSNSWLGANGGFDGVVTSTSGLFLAWSAKSTGTLCSLVNPINNTQSSITVVSNVAGTNFVSVTDDKTQTPKTMWVGMAHYASGVQYAAVTPTGSPLGLSTIVIGSGSVAINASSFVIGNVAMTAQNGSMTAFVEVNNNYIYNVNTASNAIYKQVMGQTGSGSAAVISQGEVVRGLGIASKAFLFSSTSYFMGLYVSPLQSTYFLVNSTGQVQAKVSYGNAYTSYYTSGIPQAQVMGSSCYIPYITQRGIYAPFGINLAEFNFLKRQSPPKEIGQNLIVGGGFLGAYDGQQFSENGFFLYPDSIFLSSSSASGALSAQTYFYQALYRWTDNNGNTFNSSPSIITSIATVASGSTIQIQVPTLRLSYKNYPYNGGSIRTPPQIRLYRASTNQPVYYNVANYVQSSQSAGLDSVAFFDAQSDLQLLQSGPATIGPEIIYTNGGVVEDVNGPATSALTSFDSRLWLIDGEDKNLLWYSKQVIEGTPVEMSDLLTFFVAPTVGAEGPTGEMKALAPLDDKLIIFKDSALYYINGIGPDNTGANNQYSDPIFITSGVGSSNPNSIVLVPMGLMFQSNKGIWLLGRDLSTKYIGQDVEPYNSSVVVSAITIPNTNQVRFTLDSGVTLLYDYYVSQWGTFNGIPGISSALYQGLHTFVNSSSSLYQETPGLYSDPGGPVVMSFQTGWLNLVGLQGYQRAYRTYLLGTYYSPHNFTMGVDYDYDSSITQTITVNPTNTVGSGSIVEQWQLNFQRQQCQSFRLTFNEIASQSAGQGLTISGLNLVYGAKKSFPRDLGPSNQKS